MDSNLINSIKAINDSIIFDEDSQLFIIENVDIWISVAKRLREDFEFDYLKDQWL